VEDVKSYASNDRMYVYFVPEQLNSRNSTYPDAAIPTYTKV
jgi:hypothetical protein